MSFIRSNWLVSLNVKCFQHELLSYWSCVSHLQYTHFYWFGSDLCDSRRYFFAAFSFLDFIFASYCFCIYATEKIRRRRRISSSSNRSRSWKRRISLKGNFEAVAEIALRCEISWAGIKVKKNNVCGRLMRGRFVCVCVCMRKHSKLCFGT